MIYGLLGGILWALDTVVLSMALAPFSLQFAAPAAATMLHDGISSLILLVLQAVQGKLKEYRSFLFTRRMLLLMAAGLLGGPLGMCGYVFSIRFLGPGLSAVLSCLYPAIGAFAGVVFLKEKFGLRQWGGLVLSLAGACVLSFGSAGSVPDLIPGLFCAGLCVFCWGAEGIVVQLAMQKEAFSSMQVLTIRQTTSFAAFLVLVLPLLHGWPAALEMVQSQAIWLVAGAAAAGTASYLCYYRAIGRIGAPRAMPLNITYAAWALVFAFLFNGTIPSWLQIACALATCAGAIICAA